MHARIMMWALCSVAGIVTGCTVNGKWNMTEISPAAATRDVDFNVITLQKDGTFYAERSDDDIQTMSGHYRCTDGLLVLNPHEGRTMVYDARLSSDGGTLHLSRIWKDRRVVLAFANVE